MEIHYISHKDSIPAPEDQSPGLYVVIDVFHFSTTVIEFLAHGATAVTPLPSEAAAHTYANQQDDHLIGGDIEVGDRHVENRPWSPKTADVDGRDVGLQSHNGAKAVDALDTDRDDIEVVIGSTVNARAVADYAQQAGGPIHLVAAGNEFELSAYEDTIGAGLIAHFINATPKDTSPIPIYEDFFAAAFEATDWDLNTLDDALAADFNTRSIVPRLDEDGSFTPVATD